MAKYRLIYFNGRGSAEPSRLVLAAAGVEYEDVRYTQEEWQAEKATGKYTFGQLPCLEVGGVLLAQSRAIARFLANEHGLNGKTNLERAKIDMVTDACVDLLQGIAKIHYEKDESKKETMKTDYTKKVTITLEGLEKMLVANNGGDGFFVGDEVTLADLSFYAQMEFNFMYDANVLDAFPKLKALNLRVAALPKIAAWLEKRPKTEH